MGECVHRKQVERRIEARIGNPFSMEIVTSQNPKCFKMPIMDPYQGLTNPIVHLQRYTQHMLISGAMAEVICKCFPLLILTDLATMWFYRPSIGTIHLWKMWNERFISQF